MEVVEAYTRYGLVDNIGYRLGTASMTLVVLVLSYKSKTIAFNSELNALCMIALSMSLCSLYALCLS